MRGNTGDILLGDILAYTASLHFLCFWRRWGCAWGMALPGAVPGELQNSMQPSVQAAALQTQSFRPFLLLCAVINWKYSCRFFFYMSLEMGLVFLLQPASFPPHQQEWEQAFFAMNIHSPSVIIIIFIFFLSHQTFRPGELHVWIQVNTLAKILF